MKSEESKLYNLRVKIAEARGRVVRKFELSNEAVPGTVFSIGGSINTPRGERYVYVHEWGAYASQEQAYLPPHMNVWDGAGVLLQRAPKAPYEYEIIRTHVSPYPRSMIDGTNIVRASMANHGVNHQFPTEATKGPDPVLVWMAGIQILKGVAGSNLRVVVGPLYYGLGAARKYFPSETVDLASYLPSAGKAVRVLLYLVTATGLIGVVSSAEVTAPGNPSYPDTPYGGIPSSYFYLEDTYTTLDMVSDYVDARRWFDGSEGSLPLPATEGQMLFSNAGNEWVPGKIVTSGGSVVVSNGDVVWSTT